jgi:hypothetical protein
MPGELISGLFKHEKYILCGPPSRGSCTGSGIEKYLTNIAVLKPSVNGALAIPFYAMIADMFNKPVS